MENLSLEKVGKAVKKIKAGKSRKSFQSQYVTVKNGFLYAENDDTILALKTDLKDGVYHLDMIEHGVAVEVNEVDEIQDVNFEKEYKPLGKIKNAMLKGFHAISKDYLRPHLQGFNISPTIVAITDAHRLYFLRGEFNISDKSFTVRKIVLEMVKHFKNDNIEIFFGDYDKVYLKFEHGYMVSRTIQGTFPNVEAVIPKDLSIKFTINKKQFEKALKDLKLFWNKATRQVKLKIKNSELIVSAQDIDRGVAKEVTLVTKSNEDFIIAFNGHFLIEAVKEIDSDNVVIEAIDKKKAVIINDNELLMPLDIND